MRTPKQGRAHTQRRRRRLAGSGYVHRFPLGLRENVVPPSESLQGISDQNTDDTAPMVVAFADIKDKAYEL